MYALNVLLLCNLTVIVVMLTDTPEPTRERASAPPRQVDDALDRHAEWLPQPGSQPEPAIAPVAVRPAAEPVPLTQVSAQPMVLASPSTKQAQPARDKPAQPQPEPTQDDPPVTFFGIGLD